MFQENREKNMLAVVLLALGAQFLIALPLSAQTREVEGIPAERVFVDQDLGVGQAVVQGTRDARGVCTFDPFAISMLTPAGFRRQIALMPDALCNLVVISKSFGPRNLFGQQALLNEGRGARGEGVALDPDQKWELVPAIATGPPKLIKASAHPQPEMHVEGDIRVSDPIGLWLTRNITEMAFIEGEPGCTLGDVCLAHPWIPDCDTLTFDVLDCHIDTIDPLGWEIFYGSTSEFECTSAVNPFCRNIYGDYIPWKHKLNVLLRGRVDGDGECIFSSSGDVPGVVIAGCDCTES